MNDEEYDLFNNDLSNLNREELIDLIRTNQDISINAIAHFNWIMEAFVLAVQDVFHFGKGRIQKLLKRVQEIFNMIDTQNALEDFNNLIENYGFKLFFHKGKMLLRDLNADDREYFDYLSQDLRELAHKLDHGKKLTDIEKESLKILKENKDE